MDVANEAGAAAIECALVASPIAVRSSRRQAPNNFNEASADLKETIKRRRGRRLSRLRTAGSRTPASTVVSRKEPPIPSTQFPSASGRRPVPALQTASTIAFRKAELVL
jgi:hypothetical protein